MGGRWGKREMEGERKGGERGVGGRVCSEGWWGGYGGRKGMVGEEGVGERLEGGRAGYRKEVGKLI